MSHIKVYQFKDKRIKYFAVDRTVWFVAKDAAESLEYKRPSDAIAQHCRNAVFVSSLINYGEMELLEIGHRTKAIGKKDLYRLILRSEMPEAEKFEDEILELVIRYEQGDITLAAEVLDRNDNQDDALWLVKRAEGKVKRLEFTDELDKRKGNRKIFGKATNAVYEGLYRKNAKQLKIEKGIKKDLRNNLTTNELMAVSLAEGTSVEQMQKRNSKGNQQCLNVVGMVSTEIGNALERINKL